MLSIFRGFVAALVVAGAGFLPLHYVNNANQKSYQQYAQYVQQTNQNEQANFQFNDDGE
ncbi:MAG TPA: hypothetical protein H9856_00050 [Candidatus Limosilactobacillus merdigallinarum]|uniref:Uncharacterized protein n=1 Tax=Candidatus Limosilactobacillus merdigallinarum TaxID=2838652 RepID=A0A9D2AKI1_9LACO|nr:hypothetical protein [Candidatus Limosilactobacillus merdigallinarum]